MIAVARFPLRSDPVNNQFERPSAHGRIWFSTWLLSMGLAGRLQTLSSPSVMTKAKPCATAFTGGQVSPCKLDPLLILCLES
ncbi:hypothetical protein D3C84_245960 [compost metagenome]